MKKTLSLLLVLALALTMAVPAFAVTPEGNNASQDVTAAYKAATTDKGETIYRVTLTWNPSADSNLTYSAGNTTYKWDTNSLTYSVEKAAEPGWSGSAGYTITVTNYSNGEVIASAEATNTYSLDLSDDNEESVTLERADKNIDLDVNPTDEGTATTASFEYTYSASESATAPTTSTTDTTVTVGTITVTISV